MMADIQITGLTSKQKALCDIIWACESKDSVLRFIASLPKKDRQQAEVMLEMMTWAFLDTVESTDLAQEVLDSYR